MTWVTCYRRLESTVHEPNGVRDPGVLGHRAVVIVGLPVGLQNHVFKHAAKSNGVPNFRLAFFRKTDALGVAPAFNVKDTIGRPPMFVISYQGPLRICRKRRLSSARKPKEQRYVVCIFTVHVA